jgi:hypothetical protein
VNTFFHNIETRFDSFKKNIKKLSRKNDIEFDEDIFMDTIIKCANTFQNENATNTDVDIYFWTAFKQNIYSNFSRNKFRNSVNFDDFNDDIFNEEYNADIDEIIVLIKNEVKNKFGDDIYKAWILHICNNYTYKELEDYGYKGLNMHNEFKQIKRYINQKFVNKNNNLKRLLRENNFL